MTAIPALEAIRNAANQGVLKQLHEDVVAALKEMLGVGARSTLTIAAGVVTPTTANHAIDTDGGGASYFPGNSAGTETADDEYS